MKNLDMSKLILYTCFQSYFCLLKSCFGKCLQKMSPEKLFEKFVKSAEIFKSDKSGQQKNLYRLVNQLDWLFILPPYKYKYKIFNKMFFLSTWGDEVSKIFLFQKKNCFFCLIVNSNTKKQFTNALKRNSKTFKA